MSTTTSIRPDRYAYISGRIRALELRLLDSSRYSRLFDARSQEDISRVLSESSYPEASDPEISLSQELTAIYEMLRTLMPDPQFVDIMLMFHDFHNIKVVLKYLSPWWSKPDEEIPQTHDVPELEIRQENKAKPSLQTIHNLLQQPAMISPPDLFQALAERRPGQVPDWAFAAAVAAVKSYQSSYDIADIDLVLDRMAYNMALSNAKKLQNDFFTGYLQKRVDLINLGILLRIRYLQSGKELLNNSLLTGGLLAADNLKAMYGADSETLRHYIITSPYPSLAEFVEDYGKREVVTRFSQETDNILMRHISKAKLILSGPEIPLAYLFARELEIRNVRIILACLRNGLSSGRARAMMRDSYLAWR